MATITKRGKTWRVQIRRKGSSPISRSFDTRGEARRFALGVESDALTGRYLHNNECMTLHEGLTQYAKEVSPTKAGCREELSRIKTWKQWEHIHLPLNEVKPSHLKEWLKAELAKNSPSTAVKKLATVSHLYTTAVKEWEMDLDNPVLKIKKPEVKNERNRRLEGDEYEVIMKAAAGIHREFPSLIILAVETGLRRTELVTTRWELVNLKRRVLILRKGTTKNGEYRYIPLSLKAVAELEKLKDMNKGKQAFTINPDSATRKWAKRRRVTGLKDIKLHDMRHEATSRFFEYKKMSAMEVASITGHKDLKMLARYTHLNPELLLAKMDTPDPESE